MWTRSFWLATAERALKTLAQGLLVIFGGGVSLEVVKWDSALLGVLALTVASVLTSIVSAGVNPSGSPSLVDEAPYGRHAKQ